MLKALRTGLGLHMAMVLAVLAAFCMVAPPAVLAFGHGTNTAHCLANADVADHGMHVGAGDSQHGDHGKQPGTHAPGCCGLYCMSALPLALPSPLVELPLAEALALPTEQALHRHAPHRLDRPPISLLSV